jgi:hypothetical protein
VKLLLFAGAGTSIELGVPGMCGLAEEFGQYCKQWDVEPDLVDPILGANLDIEHLIEELDRASTARSALGTVPEIAATIDRFDKVRAEVEWFVQHSAERVVPHEAQVLWGSTLRIPPFVNLTIVTTNYDRAIELAAHSEGLYLDDGFRRFDHRETAPWVGFQSDDRQIPFIKLHGSTDWYSDASSGRPIKLRHPMPLFGRAALELADGHKLGSSLVLPSREKLLTRDPYPRLSQAFLNACDRADVAIFVGSSLRDAHTRSAAEAIAAKAHLFIVNPEGATFGIENAKAVAQCASRFLISTLPDAYTKPDVAAALIASSTEKKAYRTGILHEVRQSLDPSISPSNRCTSLELLDSQSVVLPAPLLQKLIEDADASVARYALGLIPLSSSRRQLLHTATTSAHAGTSPFSDDLTLLKAMINA